VSLPNELALYTTEENNQLQLVQRESNSEPSVQSDYAQVFVPTIADNISSSVQEKQPLVLSRKKRIVTLVSTSRPTSHSRKSNRHATSIVVPKTLETARKEKKTIKKEPVVPADSSATASDQVTEEHSSLRLVAKGGHQVYFDNPNDKKAMVVAIIPSRDGKYPLLHLPLAYKSPSIDLWSLSKQPSSYQQNRVRVCFPAIDTKGIGYICIEDHGLQGGGRIRIDEYELIQAITSGYGTLGREPETLADWRSFLGTFTQGLSSVDLALTSPSNPATFDPGNMRDMFLHMARNITGRNVQLENYGESWSRIVNQARSKIRKEQSLSIDPSAYPRDSYTIVLLPNASRMRPFIGEMDRIYSTSVSGNVNLDFNNILGAVDVEVNFNTSFHEFENIERERQENERREQVRRIVDRVMEEVENIESDFINLKSHLQGLNLTDPSSSEDVKKIINSLKFQNEVLMRKIAVLDDLAGADEETRAKRKSLVVSKVSVMLDEIDRLLRESHEALKEQERKKREEEEKLFVNPTGKDIRNDSEGLGHFGAPRGIRNGKKRFHEGIDFSATVGQTVVAPLSGKVINFKGAKTGYPMLQLYPSKAFTEFDYIQILYVHPPIGVNMGEYRQVSVGSFIGIAASLQDLGYSAGVTPHIHLELKKNMPGKNPVSIDPKSFFF
jgi:murein DD-endopeptidase MepM/ murein hydrolase activator NlpD